MPQYLFRFGFCTPAQWAENGRHGWDDESSSCVFVSAQSRDDALAWGREVAEAFVRSLFEGSGWSAAIPSWKTSGFAHWLEESPESEFTPDQLQSVPVVRLGEFPDFARL
jgi:hypothetical protein